MDNGSVWSPSSDRYLAWDNAVGDLPIAGDWNADGRARPVSTDLVLAFILRWITEVSGVHLPIDIWLGITLSATSQ